MGGQAGGRVGLIRRLGGWVHRWGLVSVWAGGRAGEWVHIWVGEWVVGQVGGGVFMVFRMCSV